MPCNRPAVPESRRCQVRPSAEVMIVPPQPTATNRPSPQVTLWSSLAFAAFLADSVELRESISGVAPRHCIAIAVTRLASAERTVVAFISLFILVPVSYTHLRAH